MRVRLRCVGAPSGTHLHIHAVDSAAGYVGRLNVEPQPLDNDAIFEYIDV